MALMIGAMMVHGITPGPNYHKQPALFWGPDRQHVDRHLMLVILNLPLIGIWVRLLQVPYRYLFPSILILCCIGTYTLSSSVGDVLVMTAFASSDTPPQARLRAGSSAPGAGARR